MLRQQAFDGPAGFEHAAAGLLDELTVSILPVVLGAGIPLFQGIGPCSGGGT